MVRRAMASSRTAAQAMIESGRVRVGGAVAAKSSRLVAPSEAVHICDEPPQYVSRGGRKLDDALDAFGIDVTGLRALDAGASTGGFVDCLLQRGAISVIAVDVGWGQLDARLRADDRVTVRERCNVRYLTVDDIGDAVEVVTADLSFISLRTVMKNLSELAAPGGDVIALVKPQFEAGRREASKRKGIIVDPDTWQRVLDEVAQSARAHQLVPVAVSVSPLRGAAGNVEFFLHCVRDVGPGSHAPLDIAGAVRQATHEAATTKGSR